MNLLQSLRGRDTAAPGAGPSGEERFTLDDYASWVTSFGYQGVQYGVPQVQQTLAGNVERTRNDFAGLVQSAYQSAGVVFAVMLTRQLLFSAVRFQWQELQQGRPSQMFGNRQLEILETPWPGGTTQDLLNRVIQDADLAGNYYATIDTPLARIGGDGGQELVRLRPDWVDVVLEPRRINGGRVGWRKIGYLYSEDGDRGRPEDAVPFLARDVAHYAPIPDPLAQYRGMSWLTPIVREIQADKLMTTHKRRFFENGATPNMVIKHPPQASPEKVRAFRDMLAEENQGVDNAYRPLHIGGGADATVVGNSMEQITFREVQGVGETRIAAAGRVSPVIVGLSEGLQGSSLNAGNYGMARRNVADGTMHPLWQNVAGSLAPLVGPAPAPLRGGGGAVRLWYDTRDVPFLREDEKDAAEIAFTRAQMLRQLIESGWTAESAKAALLAGNEGPLVHTGNVSVQLQPPGTGTATPTSEEQARALAEVVQKIYLGVGTVLTADEAREIVNNAGGDLPVPGPGFDSPPAAPAAGGQQG